MTAANLGEDASSLSAATRIGVLGDTHGDMGHLLTVSQTMWKLGVSVLLVLGDFGFVWPGRNWNIDLDKLSRRLASRRQTLYFLDGNHELFPALYKFPVSDHGLRRLRPNIIHIPRGYRTKLASRRTLAALGGANSIDRDQRDERSWWRDESITEDDLAVLGSDHADLMVGHDAPLGAPSLDARLIASRHEWLEAGVAYSESGRRMFHRGFLQVRPQLYLGGHYHLHVDDTVDYETDGESFTCRVVILDVIGSVDSPSWAVLDVWSLELQLDPGREEPVTELTGDEPGVWHVHTLTSIHVFDLDAGTVERRPGPDALSYPTDPPRRLRNLYACRVGEPGFWTIHSDDLIANFYWHASSEVSRIERVKENG